MFIRAIDTAVQFTRPIHTIQRFYGSKEPFPGAATLFFVNQDGWALTCRHVAQLLVESQRISQRKAQYDKDFAARLGGKKGKQIKRELESRYNLNPQTVLEIKARFVDCIQGQLQVHFVPHSKYDVALLQFQNFTQLQCNSFPVFPAATQGLKQGKFLCRLGFPFPEFKNFAYDSTKDTIDWTQTGRADTPIFPIEGMLTRYLADDVGKVYGFELSTAGLKGQSGGPAFDTDGLVWGIQFATNHLDFDFDVDREVVRNGLKKKVRDSAFLHIGHCIHVDVLKDFMQQNNVAFTQV